MANIEESNHKTPKKSSKRKFSDEEDVSEIDLNGGIENEHEEEVGSTIMSPKDMYLFCKVRYYLLNNFFY